MPTAALPPAEQHRVPIIDPPAPLPCGLRLPPPHEKFSAREGELWFRELRVPLWANAEFKVLWKTRKLDFLKRGYSIKQQDGAWVLQQWLAGPRGGHYLTNIGAEKLRTAINPPDALPIEAPPVLELELPPLPHGLEDFLYEYQRQPARQLYRAVMNGKAEWGYPGAWDCSDLGTGKTFQALAAALATGLEVGVICPKSVIGTYPKYGGKGSGWLGAFAHFKQIPAFVLNYESLRTGNREFVRKTGREGRPFEWTPDPEHTILIWDEAHNIKNKSLNRSMAFGALRQGFPCLFVSGTMAQSPMNLGATGVAVGLHQGDKASYEQFLASHGCTNFAGSWDFPKGRAGAVHLAKIHRVVFPKRGARVKIADLGDRFPETQILCESVETEDVAAINAAWDKAKQIIADLEAQGVNEGHIKMMTATAYMEAWHASERVKVPTICDMVRREIEEGRSVAVFVNFTDVREELARELKTQCMIYGAQRDRDTRIAEFQSGRSRVIICNIKAGGVGISLHDVDGEYPRTAIILPTNNAVEMGQALGRVHRAGGKSRSRQLVLFAAGSIEEQICESTRRKLSAITTLNDGDLQPADKF